VVTRMRNGETAIADQFDNVTILFSDLVGFTALATGLPPGELIDILSTVFSRFDRAVAGHGLEKIKTIGDAYMVVAGIPQAVPDHALQIAQMAEDIIAAVTAYAARSGSDLSIRIGVHSGPVVAGVIGQKKFIYDLWGDTVNTASRMESHGVANRVQVSEVTAELLRDRYDLEPRGEIDIKGKGKMRTFLLVSRRDGI